MARRKVAADTVLVGQLQTSLVTAVESCKADPRLAGLVELRSLANQLAGPEKTFLLSATEPLLTFSETSYGVPLENCKP